MKEMEDTVKQLKLDEGELLNKLNRRKQELERAEKRLKGIENVKPEYQEEYERLEAELERFYNIYVEKFTNIDYLEHELDMYNVKDSLRRKLQQEIIDKFKNQQMKAEKEEIFNDERDEEEGMFENGHD
jgi:clusterin-associated protein 1